MNGPAGLDNIQSFLILAEELNFRRAAERLGLSKSIVSRRVARLEAALLALPEVLAQRSAHRRAG